MYLYIVDGRAVFDICVLLMKISPGGDLGGKGQ